MAKKSNFNRILKLICILAMISIIFLNLSEVASGAVFYYDPNNTISSAWSMGSGTTFAEVNDSIRVPSQPDTTSFVAARAVDNVVSEFRFLPITQVVKNMTLWVYTGTGGNVQYAFSLNQNGTARCTTTIVPSTSSGWYNCSWTSVSGDMSNMSVYLGDPSKIGGGAATLANVSAAYLEVYEALPPNITNLSNPQNNTITNNSIVDFNFTVTDDIDSVLPNCTLWGNFSGLWEANETIVNVNDGAITNITLPLNDGTYLWNYQCFNSKGLSSFFTFNYTFAIDTTPPNITIIDPLNNTDNKSTNTILFLYNVSDSSNISNCTLYINNQFNESNSSIQKDVTLNFTKYMPNDNYTWRIECFDYVDNAALVGNFNLNVSVYNPFVTFGSTIGTIILNAGGVKNVYCNFTVEDGNGFGDIYDVNATFYSATADSGDIDNNNTHYTNVTCLNTASSGNQSDYSCQLPIYYYALNGTWYCNASASDYQLLTGNNQTNATIDTLYAVNVSTDIIDYGDVASGQYSNDQTVNVTNMGNMPINVSVKGFGGDDPVPGDGLAMLCQNGENISVSNERFSINPLDTYALKNMLSSLNQDLGMTMLKQTNPAIQTINSTYWQLYVPPLQVTKCNGTVTFTATIT